jgi:tetratricopeptide (TPR) repeat protein
VAEAALAVAPPAPPPVLDVEPLPRPGSPSVAAVRSYLDAGCASLSAGAVSAGVGQLQAAVSAAAAVGDDRLSGLTQLALASALIHSTGGRGAQVTALLHRSLTAAREADDPRTAAAACRELGILAVYGGRRAAAERWLHAAGELADDDAEHARILGVRGMSLTDGGNYPEAIEALDASVVHARRAGAWRQQAWSQSMLGRLFVLREEPAAAALVLDEALEVVRSERWTAFVPWPEAFRAEAALQLDEVRTASELLDHAWVLAQETLDHCWIPTVAHGMARLVARDDPQEALQWCRRGLEPRPWYLWPRVRLLDAGCDIAAGRDTSVVARWAAELLEAAAGAAMHELTARAYIHRARLGDTKAMTAAHDVAAGIANPALHSLLTVQAAIA